MLRTDFYAVVYALRITVNRFTVKMCHLCSIFASCLQNVLGVGAGLVPWVGGPPDASFGFYIREAFQSQTTQKRYYRARIVRH